MLNIFGNIQPPIQNSPYFKEDGTDGLFALISNFFKIAGAIAGLFFLVQIISAGFSYMSANGDPKKTEAAWTKIWQSLIGIIIIASAFIISSVIGLFLNIDILNPFVWSIDG